MPEEERDPDNWWMIYSPWELAQMVEKLKAPNERLSQAVALASVWTGIEGTHHLRWLIDQMLRVLLADGYEAWVTAYNEEAAREDFEEWDVGIAP